MADVNLIDKIQAGDLIFKPLIDSLPDQNGFTLL